MSLHPVTVEGQRAVTRQSGHEAVAAIDICLTPVGPNLVPLPYVNRATAANLKNGSSAVRFGGASVMLAGAQLRPSTGNEAAAGGGIVSRVTCGPTDTLQTSVCVTVEGAHVVRSGDVTLQNGKNTVGTMHERP